MGLNPFNLVKRERERERERERCWTGRQSRYWLSCRSDYLEVVSLDVGQLVHGRLAAGATRHAGRSSLRCRHLPVQEVVAAVSRKAKFKSASATRTNEAILNFVSWLFLKKFKWAWTHSGAVTNPMISLQSCVFETTCTHQTLVK